MKQSELKELVKEAYTELVKELEAGVDQPNQLDLDLGDVSTKLAQSKGELATLLDKAERAGIINRANGSIKILKKDDYVRLVGDLPKKIKLLQQRLEPSPHEED